MDDNVDAIENLIVLHLNRPANRFVCRLFMMGYYFYLLFAAYVQKTRKKPQQHIKKC